MTIVFFGTPEFAVPTLRMLADEHRLLLVVSQPDRPSGRGQRLQLPATKQFAVERGIPVAQPEKVRDPAFLERIRELEPDAIAVAAYGKILPKSLLEIPRFGAINVHGSLLPKYRGAAPIQRAILEGERTTGITIMQMNERMDAGDILATREIPILPEDTSGSLGQRLAAIGADALLETLRAVERGEATRVPQIESDATVAPIVRKEEAQIDWQRPADTIERTIRAFTPWPGTNTRANGRLLKIHRAAATDENSGAAPGTVVVATGGDLRVATGSGTLALLELQLEGKRRLGTRDFLAGGAIHPGDRLE